MVTALWVGSTCRPPAIGSVATLYRISPDKQDQDNGKRCRQDILHGISSQRRRGQNCRLRISLASLRKRDFRSDTWPAEVCCRDARPGFDVRPTLAKPALAEPKGRNRLLNQTHSRGVKPFVIVVGSRTAICRASVRSEAQICSGVTAWIGAGRPRVELEVSLAFFVGRRTNSVSGRSDNAFPRRRVQRAEPLVPEFRRERSTASGRHLRAKRSNPEATKQDWIASSLRSSQ